MSSRRLSMNMLTPSSFVEIIPLAHTPPPPPPPPTTQDENSWSEDDIDIEEVATPKKRCDREIIVEIVTPNKKPLSNDLSDDDDVGPGRDIIEVVSPVKPKNKFEIRSTRTLLRQLDMYLPIIELDAAVCFFWNIDFQSDGRMSWKALVKDGDNIFSLLESPCIFNQNEENSLTMGQCYRFTGLVILRKITRAMSTALLSTISNAGYEQDSYHSILVTSDTKWIAMSLPAIDIEHSQTPFVQELETLKFSSRRNTFVSHRVSEGVT